ncbi:hypothetical protein KI387_009853, partial [Taxus chinensis]
MQGMKTTSWLQGLRPLTIALYRDRFERVSKSSATTFLLELAGIILFQSKWSSRYRNG